MRSFVGDVIDGRFWCCTVVGWINSEVEVNVYSSRLVASGDWAIAWFLISEWVVVWGFKLSVRLYGLSTRVFVWEYTSLSGMDCSGNGVSIRVFVS